MIIIIMNDDCFNTSCISLPFCLFLLAAKGHKDCVEVLLRYSAPLDGKDKVILYEISYLIIYEPRLHEVYTCT